MYQKSCIFALQSYIDLRVLCRYHSQIDMFWKSTAKLLPRFIFRSFILFLIAASAYALYYLSTGFLPAKVSAAAAEPAFDRNTTEVKLLVVIYDPILENFGGVKTHEFFGWTDPAILVNQLRNSFAIASHGKLKYTVVETIERDEWPLHLNGSRYTDQTYVIETSTGNWTLGPGDYPDLIAQNWIEEKLNQGLIDEVWLFGGPGFDWHESAMMGKGAYFINGDIYDQFQTKAAVIMGFNYEREIPQALESYAHRTESILRRIYGSWDNLNTHDWNKFTQLDQSLPGKGGLGNAHLAFNSREGYAYDWSSPDYDLTTADDWLNFPNLTGNTTLKNCNSWACSDLGYFTWWYGHMPHVPGTKQGVLNNWWRYIANPHEYRNEWAFPKYPELTEGNSIDWACFSEDGTSSCDDSVYGVVRGDKSVKLTTQSGTEVTVQYPSKGEAHFNLSQSQFVSTHLFSYNFNPLGYQNAAPELYVKTNDTNYYKYSPVVYELMNEQSQYTFRIPLAGDDFWIRTVVGTPTLSDINKVELHFDTWGVGFQVYIDGFGFGPSLVTDQQGPSVSITTPAPSTGLDDTVKVEIAATDALSAVHGVELLLDGQSIQSDSLSPFIFYLNTELYAPGQHQLSALSYDSYGNLASSAPITVFFNETVESSVISGTPYCQPTRAALSWTTVENAVSYRLERCAGDSCADYSLLYTIPAAPQNPPNQTAYDDSVADGVPHSFRVKGINSVGASGPWSNSVTVTTDCPTPTPPPLQDPVISGTGLCNQPVINRLIWGPGDYVNQYQIQSCIGNACSNFAPLTSVSTLYYSHIVAPGSIHRYRVRGCHTPSGACSNWSNILQLTPICPSPSPTPPPPNPPGQCSCTAQQVVSENCGTTSTPVCAQNSACGCQVLPESPPSCAMTTTPLTVNQSNKKISFTVTSSDATHNPLTLRKSTVIWADTNAISLSSIYLGESQLYGGSWQQSPFIHANWTIGQVFNSIGKVFTVQFSTQGSSLPSSGYYVQNIFRSADGRYVCSNTASN